MEKTFPLVVLYVLLPSFTQMNPSSSVNLLSVKGGRMVYQWGG